MPFRLGGRRQQMCNDPVSCIFVSNAGYIAVFLSAIIAFFVALFGKGGPSAE